MIIWHLILTSLGIPACFPQPGGFLVQFNESLEILFCALVLRAGIIYKVEHEAVLFSRSLSSRGQSDK